MNNPELFVMLIIGTVLMSILMWIQLKWYRCPSWKGIIIAIVLVFTGLFGSRVSLFIENGYFHGRSFYGAIFLAPLVYIPVAWILRIPYGKTMDLVAPAGCLTLALVKIQCLRDGCCAGIELYLDENHNYVKFPSQIVEMAVFLALSGILLTMSYKEKNRTRIFPWFLILYGSTRFVLNFFRGRATPYALGLSAGSFWSLLGFLAGVIVLTLMKLRRSNSGVAET